jgi:hypothetical protein
MALLVTSRTDIGDFSQIPVGPDDSGVPEKRGSGAGTEPWQLADVSQGDYLLCERLGDEGERREVPRSVLHACVVDREESHRRPRRNGGAISTMHRRFGTREASGFAIPRLRDFCAFSLKGAYVRARAYTREPG